MPNKAASRKRAKARSPKLSPMTKAKPLAPYTVAATPVLRNVTLYMQHYYMTTGVPVSRVSVHAWMKSGRLRIDTSTGTPLIVGDDCPIKQRNHKIEVADGQQ